MLYRKDLLSLLLAAGGTAFGAALPTVAAVPAPQAPSAILVAPAGYSTVPASPPGSGSADGVFKLGTLLVIGEKPSQADLVPASLGFDAIALLEKRDLAEALATIPGVTLTRFGGRNESSVYVRGFGRNQTPLFIDGIPVYVPYDGFADLARFTTYDIGAIQVSKGFSSVLYGPNTMGGAINVVSRQPAAPFEGQLSAGLFSGGGFERSVNVGTRQPLWYAQFGASSVDQDTFPLSSDFMPVKSENGGDRENAFRNDWKVSGKVAITPRAGDEYALGFARQEGEKGNPPYTGTIASQLKYWSWPRWDKQTVYLLSNLRLGVTGYLRPRLYYDWYNNSLMQYKDATYTTALTGSSGPSWYHDRSYGASLEAGGAWFPAHALRFAAHVKRDHHDEQILGQPNYLFDDSTVSLALEDTWRPAPLWELQAGLSFDSRESLRAQQTNPDGSPVPLTRFDALHPQIGLFRELPGLGSVHATVAHKGRFPTIKDRFSYKFNTAFPNPYLEQETALHCEIGYTGKLGRGLTMQASVYVSRIHDAIQSVSNVAGTTRTQNQNVGTVENRGLDVGLDYAPLPGVRFGAGYTYLHQENRTQPAIKATDTPVHSGNIHAELAVAKKVRLVPSVDCSSWRYATTDGKRLAGFATVGIKGVLQASRGLEVSLGMTNLLDKNTQLQDGYPEAGRTWFANARYRF